MKYDKRWKCYMLPYYKTFEDKERDKDNIEKNIMNCFLINKENIKIDFMKEVEHTKYSVSNERTKNYIHRFYKVNLTEMNKKIIKRAFKINKKKYKWFSLEEMEQNKNMIKKNKDIIEILKQMNISICKKKH